PLTFSAARWARRKCAFAHPTALSPRPACGERRLSAVPSYPQPSTSYPQIIHRLSKYRAMVAQDHLGRIVAGRAGDAAARMGAGTAMIEPLQRTTIIGVAQHRARGEQLIQRQRAVEDVAAEKAELALQVERGED